MVTRMNDLMTDTFLMSDTAADSIMDIILGARRLRTLVHVLEMGLFDMIESYGDIVSAFCLAKKCGYNLDVTERLLNTLVCLKLLDKIKNKDGCVCYRNSAATSKYLTRSKRPSLISVALSESHMILPMMDQLPRILKTGSSGCFAYELVRAYSDMQVIVYDLPRSTQVARKLQPEDTKSSIRFLSGDFFKDSFPTAQLFVLGHVIHDWDQENVDCLLRKVFDTLPPGGSLLILEKMLNEDKDGPEICVLNDLAMAMISRGRERSAAEYKRLLERHGFRNTQIRSIQGYNMYDVLLTRKPL